MRAVQTPSLQLISISTGQILSYASEVLSTCKSTGPVLALGHPQTPFGLMAIITPWLKGRPLAIYIFMCTLYKIEMNMIGLSKKKKRHFVILRKKTIQSMVSLTSDGFFVFDKFDVEKNIYDMKWQFFVLHEMYCMADVLNVESSNVLLLKELLQRKSSKKRPLSIFQGWNIKKINAEYYSLETVDENRTAMMRDVLHLNKQGVVFQQMSRIELSAPTTNDLLSKLLNLYICICKHNYSSSFECMDEGPYCHVLKQFCSHEKWAHLVLKCAKTCNKC
uniref:ShKT domain-containing protein n=1 Tax=Heterorhabditis bacteriophora TaxID=37862 RepID=A0A1I7WJH9_HETBA